ncbi:ABC transporter, ATP-binding/permease protein [Clostridiaceae bacterium JG1575]|nr:ABC transporter, ATP-binding/permease protein [Clostridiaceae bacterium JG1575]
MIAKIQKRFALSEQGAKDLVKAVLSVSLQSMALMLPVSLLFLLSEDLLNGGIPENHRILLIGGSVLCLLLIFLTSFLQYTTAFFATYLESKVRRISLAEHIRKLPLAYFGQRDLADLTSTIMADSAFLETVFSHFVPQLFGSMIATLLIALSLFFFDATMALAAIWVIPVAYLIIFSSARVQYSLGRKDVAVKMACADSIQECIETVRDIKANNAQERVLQSVDESIRSVERRLIRNELATSSFMTCAQLVLKLGMVTVALTGSYRFVQGKLSILSFFLFLLVVSRLYDPVSLGLQNFTAILISRSHIDRMKELMDYPIQSGRDVMNPQGFDVVFEGVGFSYNEGEEVLKDVSFCARQGEVTALVGPSGGGKTTVSRLAARFWDPDGGTILVGGVDIKTIDPETLLSYYAIVFQDVTLFNNTVMENIRIGKKDATDEEVLAAARRANCDEFAQKLPKGYDSEIGENGARLSGGERQRISIARAFLKDAPILLLDEATASLDVDNETIIQEALSRLIQDKTVLVIAHRLRTVSGADHVVVLAQGRVAQEGSPKELAQRKGLYQHMCQVQNESQNWSLV